MQGIAKAIVASHFCSASFVLALVVTSLATALAE